MDGSIVKKKQRASISLVSRYNNTRIFPSFIITVHVRIFPSFIIITR